MINIEDLEVVMKFKKEVRMSILYLPMVLALPVIKSVFVQYVSQPLLLLVQ